jgi:carbamoyl-phosphate synthase large subunit
MKKTGGTKILITGSGAPGWVPIYKCLKNNGDKRPFEIYGCDLVSQTAGSFYAQKHFQVPKGEDKNYTETLLNLAVKEKIDIIVPLSDPEFFALAESRQKFFDRGIKISVSDYHSVETASNKKKLFNHLAKVGLPHPTYHLAKNWSEFKSAVRELGYPDQPVCFKPPLSYGSRGFRIIDAKIDQFDSFINQKSLGLYITLEEIEKILANRPNFPELLVMEYLPGKEYTVDVLASAQKIEYAIPRLRLKTKQGVTVEGLVEKNDEIIELSKKIISSLGLRYAVGVQFKYDRNEKPKVLEVNPRLQVGTVLCYGAGVNIPYYNILAIEGKKIPRVKVRYGTHMHRHWQETFFHKSKKLFSD